ncbi:MAG: UDP-N-acetylmuramoyl-tripeptide--D-alanyl-D-alanine ligase [Dehalococcoidia bacterium]
MLTADEIEEGLAGHLVAAWGYTPGAAYQRVVVDSRQASGGDLFVALAGEHLDGHDFITEAVERGAAGVLAQRPPQGLAEGVAIFQVTDTLFALQLLARRRLAQNLVKVIAITGSVGKTTCKELTAAVLSRRYAVLGSQANLNSEVGLPISLLELTPGHQRAVLEMAMYQRGDIRFLCEMTRPQIGVVTNVGPSHMERLGSLEAIALAKAELPESLPSNGFAILNGDDPLAAAMAQRTSAGVILYGTSPGCTVRAEDVASHGLEGISFRLRLGRRQAPVRLPLPGRHNLHNALAAAAVALADGMPLAEVAEALSAAPVPSRIRVAPGHNGSTIIDDTYNASPASMLAALDLLKEMPGRAIAFLGDMRELGPYHYEGHRHVGQRAAQVADVIYAVGEGGGIVGQAAREVGHPMVRFFADKETAAQALRQRLRPGDFVLVKASRAMAFETVVEHLQGVDCHAERSEASQAGWQ